MIKTFKTNPCRQDTTNLKKDGKVFVRVFANILVGPCCRNKFMSLNTQYRVKVFEVWVRLKKITSEGKMFLSVFIAGFLMFWRWTELWTPRHLAERHSTEWLSVKVKWHSAAWSFMVCWLLCWVSVFGLFSLGGNASCIVCRSAVCRWTGCRDAKFWLGLSVSKWCLTCSQFSMGGQFNLPTWLCKIFSGKQNLQI
jgi:hypothetical protein